MATSNYTAFTLTRNQLIEAAYRKLGIPGEGNTLSTAQYSDGLIALNSVVALAVTDGMPLWRRTIVLKTPAVTTQTYSLDACVKVIQVSLRDNLSGVQYEMEGKSLYDFYRLPYNTPGIPVNWAFEPSITGGTLRIWPEKADSGSATNKSFVVIYQRKFDGFDDTTTDTMDFPPWWSLALTYYTALVLAPENGLSVEERNKLQQEASSYWGRASSYGDEEGSLFIMPNSGPY